MFATQGVSIKRGSSVDLDLFPFPVFGLLAECKYGGRRPGRFGHKIDASKDVLSCQGCGHCTLDARQRKTLEGSTQRKVLGALQGWSAGPQDETVQAKLSDYVWLGTAPCVSTLCLPDVTYLTKSPKPSSSINASCN